MSRLLLISGSQVRILLHPPLFQGVSHRLPRTKRHHGTSRQVPRGTWPGRVWRWLVGLGGDRGRGPERECRLCHKLRRDVDEEGVCAPCSLRVW